MPTAIAHAILSNLVNFCSIKSLNYANPHKAIYDENQYKKGIKI